MNRTYKMGVVGLGEGRSIMSAALKSSRWKLVNICDLNEDLCKERLEEFNFDRYTLDYKVLLDDPEIEVIAIYTPDPLHGLHIKQALEAGKHVICTKPVLTSLDEAEAIAEAQRKAQKQVFIGQSSRFFEPMIHQRSDYEKFSHGEITSIETHYITDGRWFLEKGWSLKSGFSWMYNFLIHAVDLTCWYLPEIEEVYGMSHLSANTKAYGLNIPDVLKFLFKDSKGRIASIEGSYATPCLDMSVEASISCTLRGTKGVSRGEYPNLKYHNHFEGASPQTETYENLFDYYFRFGNISHHAGEYQNYIEYFAYSLDHNVIAKPDLNEALRILAVMSAMDESLAASVPIKVKYPSYTDPLSTKQPNF